MDYGLVLFTSDRGITPTAAAKLADDHGFTTFYVPEHTHIPVKRQAAHPTTNDESLPDDRYMRTLDPWVSLGAACAVTSQVRCRRRWRCPSNTTRSRWRNRSPRSITSRVDASAWVSDSVEHRRTRRPQRTAGAAAQHASRIPRGHAGAVDPGRSLVRGRIRQFGPSWASPKPVQTHIPVLVGAAGTEKNFKWIARSADGGSPHRATSTSTNR